MNFKYHKIPCVPCSVFISFLGQTKMPENDVKDCMMFISEKLVKLRKKTLKEADDKRLEANIDETYKQMRRFKPKI